MQLPVPPCVVTLLRVQKAVQETIFQAGIRMLKENTIIKSSGSPCISR